MTTMLAEQTTYVATGNEPRQPNLGGLIVKSREPIIIILGENVTTTIVSTGPRADPLREQFRVWAARWHEETDHLSSPSRIVMHPDYLRIISKGERVLPLILEDLREHGGEWYWALRIIADEPESPVPAHAAGNRRLMDRAWLDWGKRRGYIS